MEVTVVRTEKLQTDNVTNSGGELTVRLKVAARPLTLALGDAASALVASVLSMLLISVPSNLYFQTIDSLYIPVALVCFLLAGLYDRGQLNPVTRLRIRAHAIVGSTLVELMAIALKMPITGVVLYAGARGLLFFILGFYIEYAAERMFERSFFPHTCLGAGQPVQTRRRLPDWLKRSADLSVSLVAGLLALPFVAVSAVAVWLIDRGPVFYSQKRVGQGGSTIRVLKIRTMYVDAESRLEQRLQEDPCMREEWARFFKLRHDPRVLGFIGRFLRRTSLDELPQIWNIIRGDMSLVGPRPFPSYHLDSFDQAFRQKRQSCKPGLTGLWQVSARSDGDLEVQRTLDLSYISNRSFWLDLYILLVTVPAVLKGSGAC